MNHLPKAIQNIFREPKRKTSPQKIEPEIRQIKMCDSEAFTLKKYCRNDRSAIQALHFFFSKISFWGVTLCVLFLLSSPLNAENYVTVEGDSTRYSTFHDALSAGKGTALTLHGETISLGQGFEIPGISSVESHYSISIQADSTASGTSFVTLDANRKSSFLGGLGSTVNLNVKNVEFTNGREMDIAPP